MLTRKQHELVCFINDRLNDTGISPSFEEMKDALDLKSKSGIHRLITALEERGFLRRLPNRARAIEVIRIPESLSTPAAAAPAEPRRFTPSVVEGGKSKQPQAPAAARMIEEAARARRADLYLLLDTDVEWQADPARDAGGDAREDLFDAFRAALDEFETRWEIVSGDWDERAAIARRAIVSVTRA